MTDTSKAWVWSQYCAVAPDQKPAEGPLPLFGGSSAAETDSPGGRTRRGAVLALAMVIGLFFPKIAFLLLVLAVLLVLSGMEPGRFENFMNAVPGGGAISKLVSTLDAVLR